MSKAVNLARAVGTGGVLAGGQIQAAGITGLATVASTNSYTDLINKPTIPSVAGLATQTYVDTAVDGLVNGAPGTLNTLKEIADQLAADETATAAIVTTLAGKANTSSLAAVATSGSYVDLTNKPTIPVLPTLATVATTGSYADLTNKPTIPTVPTLATVATTGSYTDLINKPTIPTNTNQLTNGAGFLTSSSITGKQDTLVSGTSIKTVNGTSLLGSGNIAITGGSGGTDYSTLSEIKIGVGAGAGFNALPQQSNGVAIGSYAGADNQGSEGVALGASAGSLNQGNSSIAIGSEAGQSNQGIHAIAIGHRAGYSSQASNSIVLNATGSALYANTTGLFVKPVRTGITTDVIYYDAGSGEMTYGAAPSGGSGGGSSGGSASITWNYTTMSSNQGGQEITYPTVTSSPNQKVFVAFYGPSNMQSNWIQSPMSGGPSPMWQSMSGGSGGWVVFYANTSDVVSFPTSQQWNFSNQGHMVYGVWATTDNPNNMSPMIDAMSTSMGSISDYTSSMNGKTAYMLFGSDSLNSATSTFVSSPAPTGFTFISGTSHPFDSMLNVSAWSNPTPPVGTSSYWNINNQNQYYYYASIKNPS